MRRTDRYGLAFEVGMSIRYDKNRVKGKKERLGSIDLVKIFLSG
jgi:hypothetical protein